MKLFDLYVIRTQGCLKSSISLILEIDHSLTLKTGCAIISLPSYRWFLIQTTIRILVLSLSGTPLRNDYKISELFQNSRLKRNIELCLSIFCMNCYLLIQFTFYLDVKVRKIWNQFIIGSVQFSIWMPWNKKKTKPFCWFFSTLIH